MRPRIYVARILTKLSRLLSSLPLMVMRPDDLIEYGRQSYASPQIVDYWGSDKVVAEGLTSQETMLLNQTGLSQGNVLILGMGGGREAIPLAKMGFAVTGIDYIPAVVAMARENAAKHGVHLDAQVGDFYFLDIPPAHFDLAMLTSEMYSSIPTRQRRIGLLQKICAALKPGGWFICVFWWKPGLSFSPTVEWLRKIFAYLTLGNLWYEPGDRLTGIEFIHAFQSETEIASEFSAGGFAVTRLHPPDKGEGTLGIALLQRSEP
jgi:SAM-dependent methyltransferase